MEHNTAFAGIFREAKEDKSLLFVLSAPEEEQKKKKMEDWPSWAPPPLCPDPEIYNSPLIEELSCAKS